ncbi:MAG: hypothetical protein A3F83_03355 [Candidatus Glassbacteria bacterium RIFCSPLOWO2_12_FULL_58_11]|uniref:Methyltransferase type 11 domain-containing protein n=1 Tax=Candidatus Glassbacteria bacterium RIFCSPLOWO2_12_FULL_58_11 TaxID=1817867 RepID=A0A1F5YRC0_9BACT|nr:MAG: hypothetical protein A3F83_03355 [Candidatus Glassbacteria bacterium RIFCSPLOWO2_12_FULL_58_11]
MTFNDDFFLSYLSAVPLPLALERLTECQIYRERTFRRPILDLGCGDGILVKNLFAEKIDAGLDPDPGELERARRLGVYKELIQCRADSIPKPDTSFNTVISNSVLEHIPSLEPVFREVYRVLAPGGRFYCTVPSNYFDDYTIVNQILKAFRLRGPAGRYKKFFNSFWKHYHYYPLDQWTGIACRCGFVLSEAFNFNPRRNCLLNDFLVPFSLPSFLIKKIFNKWVLWPSLRRRMLYPLYPVLKRLYLFEELGAQRGGLIFMSLEKAKQ